MSDCWSAWNQSVSNARFEQADGGLRVVIREEGPPHNEATERMDGNALLMQCFLSLLKVLEALLFKQLLANGRPVGALVILATFMLSGACQYKLMCRRDAAAPAKKRFLAAIGQAPPAEAIDSYLHHRPPHHLQAYRITNAFCGAPIFLVSTYTNLRRFMKEHDDDSSLVLSEIKTAILRFMSSTLNATGEMLDVNVGEPITTDNIDAFTIALFYAQMVSSTFPLAKAMTASVTSSNVGMRPSEISLCLYFGCSVANLLLTFDFSLVLAGPGSFAVHFSGIVLIFSILLVSSYPMLKDVEGPYRVCRTIVSVIGLLPIFLLANVQDFRRRGRAEPDCTQFGRVYITYRLALWLCFCLFSIQ